MQQTKRPPALPAVALGLALGTAGLTPPALATSDLSQAITGGKAMLDMRLRYEGVSQDNPLSDADALTLRTRLGYRSGDFHQLWVYGEFEDVTALVDDYAPEQAGHSVVADPEGSEVNQIHLGYRGLPDTEIRLGRQRIIHDQARFIGNVGWRQNEQTFDALRLINTSLPDTRIDYAYLDRINGILGDNTDIDAHLLNLGYGGLGLGTLSAYGYLLEYPGAPASSTQTWGVRLRGQQGLNDWTLHYLIELANQTDYRGGNNAIDADYRALELGIGFAGITARLGYELLGADDVNGFETPLATKHAYNGWADQFLNTPSEGLQDRYLSVAGQLLGFKLLGIFHDYSADRGDSDYGQEWGLLAQRSFGKHYSAGVKFASYAAEDLGVDTDKLWVWFGLRF